MTTPNDETVPRRRALPIVLLILATIIGITSVLALWVKRQALETETWVDLSAELLEDEAISDAVGTFIVTAIFENVDVEAEVAGALPPRPRRWPARWRAACSSSRPGSPRRLCSGRACRRCGRTRTASLTSA